MHLQDLNEWYFLVHRQSVIQLPKRKFQAKYQVQENKDIAKNHYEWCKANGYDSSWYKNDSLNAINSGRFVKNAKK